MNQHHEQCPQLYLDQMLSPECDADSTAVVLIPASLSHTEGKKSGVIIHPGLNSTPKPQSAQHLADSLDQEELRADSDVHILLYIFC